jgi:hypothetical protein
MGPPDFWEIRVPLALPQNSSLDIKYNKQQTTRENILSGT